MNILFMTNLFPKERENEIRSKMKFDMYDAANVLQWRIIDGIESNGGNDLFVLNHLPVDSWPKNYADKKIDEFTFSHKPGAEDINPGFCNITYIKKFLMKRPYAKYVRRWASQPADDKVILAYSLSPLFLETMKMAKKINPEIKSFAIVADLPEFAVCSKNKLKQLYCNYNCNHVNSLLQQVDGFILLTKHMAEKLNIKVPYMVMEGIAPSVAGVDKPFEATHEKTILYTGSMNKQYGILTLLEAFSKITDPNFRLQLCGLGDAGKEIKTLAEKDSRVQFLGKLPHEQILELQHRATVLVNPRQNIAEFTRYSFPSKTMEYLASGTEAVVYKLDGIPDEYDTFLHYVKDNNSETLAATLMEIANLPFSQRQAEGNAAKAFVTENKNAAAQASRVLDFIKGQCR